METVSHIHQKLQVHTPMQRGVLAYWPIASIYILSAFLASYSIQWHLYPDYMSHVMGFVLVLFGLIKLGDIVGFGHGFGQYDPIAKKSVVYGQVYPFLEIGLGILFILQFLIIPATVVTLFIYSMSLFGAVQSIFKKQILHCVCLGTYFKLPLSTVTIIESVFMVGMCVWMLFMLSDMTGMAM